MESSPLGNSLKIHHEDAKTQRKFRKIVTAQPEGAWLLNQSGSPEAARQRDPQERRILRFIYFTFTVNLRKRMPTCAKVSGIRALGGWLGADLTWTGTGSATRRFFLRREPDEKHS